MSTNDDPIASQNSGPPTRPAGGNGEPGVGRSDRFGIKAKLFLALFILSALAVLVALVGWVAFNNIEQSVSRVNGEKIPTMVTALRLAELSAEISATAPAIISSRSHADRVREQTRHAHRSQALRAVIDELKELQAAPDVLASLTQLAGALEVQLAALNKAVERRLQLAIRQEASLHLLSQTKARFLDTLEPLIDDAFFDLVINSEKVTAKSTRSIKDLVEEGVSGLNPLLIIRAESNLAAGLVAQALRVDKAEDLQPIRARYKQAVAAVERNLRQLPNQSHKSILQRSVTGLFGSGSVSDDIFDRRARALRSKSVRSDPSSAGPEGRAAGFKSAHEAFLATLSPMIDEASVALLRSTESVTGKNTREIRELIDIGANALHVLLTVRAEGNLASGILREAAGTTEASLLRPLREQFITAEGQIDRSIRHLPAQINGGILLEPIELLIGFGKADDGFFALRDEELRQGESAVQALEASRGIAVELGKKVSDLVAAARNESERAASESDRAIRTGRLLMVLFAVAGLVGALAMVFYYVEPRIVRPLNDITKAMSALASGDIAVDIPGRERYDELGRMAQALGIFRDTAIEVQRSNLQEIQTSRRLLSDAIESISEAFSLYDPEDRLVICNSKYKTLLYPEMADEIANGMKFETIVRRAAERGYIKEATGRIDQWLAERLAAHLEPRGSHVQQRGDDRWIMVSERKTDDGGIVAVYSDITELKQREAELSEKSNALELLSGQLAKYLSPQVYESIFSGKQKVALESKRKKLTVFFSDIAGFTETVDRLETEELTQLLNHYLTEMSQIALEYGATIDKYIGDAIVIFFGDPDSRGVRDDALACVNMAIAMRRRMTELQEVWRDAGIEKPLECRIGINTGFCTVGNIGSEDRMDYTIIGGGVNMASRLEAAATPGEILISYETHAHVKDQILCGDRQAIDVKGIAYPISAYQVEDPFDTRDSGGQVIREQHPNLKLDLDVAEMSEDERNAAESLLRRVLYQLRASR